MRSASSRRKRERRGGSAPQRRARRVSAASAQGALSATPTTLIRSGVLRTLPPPVLRRALIAPYAFATPFATSAPLYSQPPPAPPLSPACRQTALPEEGGGRVAVACRAIRRRYALRIVVFRHAVTERKIFVIAPKSMHSLQPWHATTYDATAYATPAAPRRCRTLIWSPFCAH